MKIIIFRPALRSMRLKVKFNVSPSHLPSVVHWSWRHLWHIRLSDTAPWLCQAVLERRSVFPPSSFESWVALLVTCLLSYGFFPTTTLSPCCLPFSDRPFLLFIEQRLAMYSLAAWKSPYRNSLSPRFIIALGLNDLDALAPQWGRKA